MTVTEENETSNSSIEAIQYIEGYEEKYGRQFFNISEEVFLLKSQRSQLFNDTGINRSEEA